MNRGVLRIETLAIYENTKTTGAGMHTVGGAGISNLGGALIVNTDIAKIPWDEEKGTGYFLPQTTRPKTGLSPLFLRGRPFGSGLVIVLVKQPIRA